MKPSLQPPPATVPFLPWATAVRLVARWLERRERVDALLEGLPSGIGATERARCQHLVLGVIRHYGRIEKALGRLVSHPPRFATRAILFVAGFELIEAGQDRDDGRVAKVVHHAVEQAKGLTSLAEARLVNAVVRKLATPLNCLPPALSLGAEELGEFFSHPAWLIRSWLAQFGPAATRALLEWNQQPAPVLARWRAPSTDGMPAFLQPTDWPGIREVAAGHWSEVETLLREGRIYLQDAATRIPVDLLAPASGETVIDVCAAPGGKSLLIADAMLAHAAATREDKLGLDAEEPPAGSTAPNLKAGRLVAVDLPGPRIERLKQNLSRVRGIGVALVQADVLEDLAAVLREHRLPEVFDAVLLDVPCSNTGVMRHRVDVKWRLQPGDFKKHPRQQLSLLHAAARLVRPGGRIVYSTCSIDVEENEHVVRSFLGGKAGGPFVLAKSVVSQPWVTGHDGGAAFLLRRRA